MIWRSKKSRSAASESSSVAATALAGAAGEGEIGAGGLTDFGSTAGGTFSSGFFSGAAIVSAVIVDPTTLFARAVGVLTSAAVDAIGVDPAVTTFSTLGAGAPASGFIGGAGLNESRILLAAATSCARMCGICS